MDARMDNLNIMQFLHVGPFGIVLLVWGRWSFYLFLFQVLRKYYPGLGFLSAACDEMHVTSENEKLLEDMINPVLVASLTEVRIRLDRHESWPRTAERIGSIVVNFATQDGYKFRIVLH